MPLRSDGLGTVLVFVYVSPGPPAVLAAGGAELQGSVRRDWWVSERHLANPAAKAYEEQAEDP